MNLESLLMYGLAAVGGWLLRHFGIGADLNVPGPSVPAPAGRSTIMATLKADIEQIVKAAVEAAVKQAIADIKSKG